MPQESVNKLQLAQRNLLIIDETCEHRCFPFYGDSFSADVKTFQIITNELNMKQKRKTNIVKGKCFSLTLLRVSKCRNPNRWNWCIEMSAITSVVMKAQPIPPIIWPSTIIGRSDLMRAFHYFSKTWLHIHFAKGKGLEEDR